MKNHLKISILLLVLFFTCILQASHIKDSRITGTATVKVTKRSLFANYIGPRDTGDIPPVSPWTSLNTDTGQTLVVWHGDPGRPATVKPPHTNDLGCGDNVGSAGKLMSPTGETTTIHIPNIENDTESGIAAAFSPKTKQYLLVYGRMYWEGCFPSFAIDGLFLDSQLNAVGQEFEIIPTSNKVQQLHPNLILDPMTNGYILVWESATKETDFSVSDSTIKSIRLDEKGQPLGKGITISKSSEDNRGFCCGRIHDLTLLPSGKVLLLFQQSPQFYLVDYWLATMDSNLTGVNKTKYDGYRIPEGSNLKDIKLGAAVTKKNDGSALLFYSDDKGIHRRAISTNGNLSSDTSDVLLPAEGTLLRDPSVAFSTTSRGTTGLLIATQKNINDPTSAVALGIALDEAGNPAGTAVQLNKISSLYNSSAGSSLVALPRTSTDENFEFVWLQTIGKSKDSKILKLKIQVEP